MSKVIQLNDHRSKLPKIRKFELGTLAKSMETITTFRAEMTQAETIKNQDERLAAMSKAWQKFQGLKAYKEQV